MKRAIKTHAAPEAIGPYSQAIAVEGWLFASGQIPLDPASGVVVEGDVAVQTRRVFDNLRGVLEAGGSGFENVVKTTVYLSDMEDFQAMNDVYAQYFGDSPPARATVEVSRLPKDVRVEIDLVARIGS